MKKILPVLAFIAIIAAVSFVCVMLNNWIFVHPRDSELLSLNKETVEVLAYHQEDIESLQGDIFLLQGDVEILQSMETTNYNVLKGILLLLQVNNDRIILLEDDIKLLKKRHLELLRAAAILQKKHWPKEKRLESSGIIIERKLESKAKGFGTTPEPKVIIQNIENELKNW